VTASFRQVAVRSSSGHCFGRRRYYVKDHKVDGGRGSVNGCRTSRKDTGEARNSHAVVCNWSGSCRDRVYRRISRSTCCGCSRHASRYWWYVCDTQHDRSVNTAFAVTLATSVAVARSEAKCWNCVSRPGPLSGLDESVRRIGIDHQAIRPSCLSGEAYAHHHRTLLRGRIMPRCASDWVWPRQRSQRG
jgi:hypothetical protein